MSDVKLSGPHTDLPAPNCDGRWVCATAGGSFVYDMEIKDGEPFIKGSPTRLLFRFGEKWTLYVPADSVSIELKGEVAAARGWEQLSETRLADIKRLRAELDSLKERQTPAVPADRPAPDREDGSYTKPAWSGWWSHHDNPNTAYQMTVDRGKARYTGSFHPEWIGWRPAPIADPSEVERLKAQRDEWVGIANDRLAEIEKLAAERDALSAKLAESETPSLGYKPGSADAIAEDFEIFCVDNYGREIQALLNQIKGTANMACRLCDWDDSEF